MINKNNHIQKVQNEFHLPFIQRFKDKITHISKIGPNIILNQHQQGKVNKSLRQKHSIASIDERLFTNKTSNSVKKNTSRNKINKETIEKIIENKQNLEGINSINQKLSHRNSIRKKSQTNALEGQQKHLSIQLDSLKNLMKTIQLPSINSKQTRKLSHRRYMMVIVEE